MTALTRRQVRGALEPFRPEKDGTWDRAAAAHLARRASFGAPPKLVDRLLELGPQEAARALLGFPKDGVKLLGDEKAAAGADVVAETARRVGSLDQVQAWWIYRMLRGGAPAVDKLALFWHGHFATSDQKVDNPRLMMRQVELFIEKGTGSFVDLLQDISRDPAMLLWLDSNSNRSGKPNENFARELMELFSLGIGNYTEEDIKQAARAFTGWHVRRGEFFFNRRAHDDSEKTVFGKKGAFGGRDIVELCVGKRACPRFLATKLFEFYVRRAPSEELQETLAELYEACGKRTGEFLAKLWSSKEFYSEAVRRALVSSPADFVVGALRTIGGRANCLHLAGAMSLMGQELLKPPSVKGWDGGDAWIDSNTLIARFRFASALAGGGEVQATIPWDELSADGVGRIIERFFPEGLPAAVSAALEGAAGGDAKLAVSGCLQLPENQYI